MHVTPHPVGQHISPLEQPLFGQLGHRSGIPIGGNRFGGHRSSNSTKISVTEIMLTIAEPDVFRRQENFFMVSVQTIFDLTERDM